MLTIVDVAGAASGGAARWRREAAHWAESQDRGDIRLVGRKERVSPGWLARRELIEPLARTRRIASNNVSFIGGLGSRVVLLRNPLHFPYPDELPAALDRRFRRQAVVVKAAAARADTVVVPCSAMAERVADHVPRLATKLISRYHPITVRRARTLSGSYILYPALPAPHKDLTAAIRQLVEAVHLAQAELDILVTAGSDMFQELHEPRLRAIGPQSLESMDDLWSKAVAVYAPSTVESFGYPVAEGRAIGLPVIGVDTPQNRDIGGRALVGYTADSVESLAEAVQRAIPLEILPDPEPFDPVKYFDWLTSL